MTCHPPLSNFCGQVLLCLTLIKSCYITLSHTCHITEIKGLKEYYFYLLVDLNPVNILRTNLTPIVRIDNQFMLYFSSFLKIALLMFSESLSIRQTFEIVRLAQSYLSPICFISMFYYELCPAPVILLLLQTLCQVHIWLALVFISLYTVAYVKSKMINARLDCCQVVDL